MKCNNNKINNISWGKITGITFNNHNYFIDNWLPGSKLSNNSIINAKIASVDFSKITNILLNNLSYFVDNFITGAKLADNSISNGKIISVDYSKLTNITYDINNFADNTIPNIK